MGKAASNATSGGSQAEALRHVLPTAPPRGAEDPRVIIPSPLKLSIEEEQRLLQSAKMERRNLETINGRMDYTSPNWVIDSINHRARAGMDVMPFMAVRHLSHLLAEGRVDWRLPMFGDKTIWHHSNFHLPLIGRILQQQIARATDYYFGTTPWMTATAIGKSDQKKAEHYTAWARAEADAAGLDGVLKDALALAFIQGEQVIQTAYMKNVHVFETVQEVCFDPTTKQPFRAQDQDFVTRNDSFVPEFGPPDPTVSPEQVQPSRYVLRRDMKTPMPPWFSRDNPSLWRWHKYTKIRTVEEGARSHCVHWSDLLVSSTARDLESATMLVHYESTPLISWISGMLHEDWERNGTTTEDRTAIISRLMSEINMHNQNPMDGALVEQPRAELLESSTVTQSARSQEPAMHLVKHWMHYQPYADGITRSICLITDPTGEIPIYYDYTDNLTHNGLRPYRCVRINPVPNRWHGVGQPQKFFQLQHLADLLLNRRNFAQTQAARVDFVRPELTIEGQANPKMEFNFGRAYRLVNGALPSDVLHSVYLQNIKDNELHGLLELVIQMAMNMSGVSNVNDSRMAGLDTAQLATGVKNLQQAGQELFGKFLSDLTPGVKAVVKDFVTLTVRGISGDRAFHFFEGDMLQEGKMSADELRNVEFDVSIDLSRYSGQQQLAELQSQVDVVTRYVEMGMKDPTGQAQSIMYPFAVAMLKVLGVKDAEAKIPKPVPMMPPAPAPAPESPATAAPTTPPPF